MTRSKNVALAIAVAGLFAASAGHAFAADKDAAGDKVKCEGVNACKGHGSCKSAKNDCAGKNGCKGESFSMLTPDECAAAKAHMKADEKKG